MYSPAGFTVGLILIAVGAILVWAVTGEASGVDIDAVKAGFGLPADVDSLTFRDLQARRQTILRRMQERERPRRRRGSDAS